MLALGAVHVTVTLSPCSWTDGAVGVGAKWTTWSVVEEVVSTAEPLALSPTARAE
jgi:hypothetical protein